MHGSATVDVGSPWHEGEIELQRSVGLSERMAVIGPRVLRDHLVEEHRDFYPRLPFIVAGAVDPADDVWATAIAGEPGFLGSPDPFTLTVAAGRDPSDPADAGLEDRDSIGLLGIELHTRRRNRLNGVIRRDAGQSGFAVEVRESFGNCPRYIRPREFRYVRDPAVREAAHAEKLEALDAPARAMIEAADTLFVASYVGRAGEERRVDVSHRGGPQGFVRVGKDGALTIPDFAGNNFFNTLGNIRSNPKAGLAFIDFTNGNMLQLTGEAEIVIDAAEIAVFPGAERLLRIRPRRIVRRPDVLPLRWVSQADGA